MDLLPLLQNIPIGRLKLVSIWSRPNGRAEKHTGDQSAFAPMKSFTLKYHDMADVLDFQVLCQTYELAAQRNWNGGDHFRCTIDDLWWEGQLEQEAPFQPEHPDSMFLCYKIR
jgi:hypothetical protein